MLAVTIDNLPGYEIRKVLGEVLGTTARQQNAFIEGIREPSGAPGRNLPVALRKWREDAIASMVELLRPRVATLSPA